MSGKWAGGKWSASVEMTNGYSTEDYRKAPNRGGPMAYAWCDKPHRLIYDLCDEVERLHAALKDKEHER